MNLRQRKSRYGFGVHFAAGLAGVFVLSAGLREGLHPSLEIWLSAGLIVIVILHARLGFAYNRSQAELEMMRSLVKRVDEDPIKKASKILPSLKVQESVNLNARDIEIMKQVREAIEADRADLYLQPIVSLPQRKPRFYEAYSRLRSVDGLILRPEGYVESAERANRIGVIDNMILLRCIQALREKAKEHPRLTVFCNLSPATLYDSEFFEHFTDYLEANTDLTSRLVFEFTYPAVKTMHERVEENLRSIARKGFVFSVDHVHSFDIDLEDLKNKNFSYVKVASSLLLGAHRGNEMKSRKLATFRKRLADYGIDLIAEKMEREDDMPAIVAMGLDYGQGNLFGAPLNAPHYLINNGFPERNAEIFAKAS